MAQSDNLQFRHFWNSQCFDFQRTWRAHYHFIEVVGILVGRQNVLIGPPHEVYSYNNLFRPHRINSSIISNFLAIQASGFRSSDWLVISQWTQNSGSSDAFPERFAILYMLFPQSRPKPDRANPWLAGNLRHFGGVCNYIYLLLLQLSGGAKY